MLDAITILGANNVGNDTDFDAWTKVNRAIAAANAGQLQGFKNRLINGHFLVNQRNADAAVAIGTASHTFAVDRWTLLAAGAGVTAQRVTTANIPGFRRALRISGAASNTGVFLRQRIEADDVADFAGQTVALAFTIFHTLGAGRVFQASLSRANAADVFTAVTQEDVTKSTPSIPNGVATRVVVPFTLSAAANTGLELTISTNGGVLAGQTVEVTGVQLERGVEDTTFEFRSVALERQICRRFGRPLVEGGTVLSATKVAAAVIDACVQFDQMRAVPSLQVPAFVYNNVSLPGAGQVSVFSGAAGFISATGAVSITTGFATLGSLVMRLNAATSFGGSLSESLQIFLGASVTPFLDAEFA